MEKENDIKINKKEMNKKLNQLYNSNEQINKRMKEEISDLKYQKITHNNNNKIKSTNYIKK